MMETTKLRLFRDRDDLSRFLVETTATERAMKLACVQSTVRLPTELQRVALCRITGRLFVDHCDASFAKSSGLALVDADVDALLPRLRPFTDAGVVVDLETAEKLMKFAALA